MNVRAKFKVESVTLYSYGEGVKMNAVCYDDDDENKSFSEFTPSGSFEMQVTNKNLFGHFKPDEEYYLDLTKAPVKEATTS